MLLFANNLILSSAATLLQGQPPPPPEDTSEYIYESGFYIKGPFLEFYNTRGEYRIFGYPRSRLYYDSTLGHWVQYFDNVRMEWHPSNAAPYQVQLGLLGESLGRRTPPIPSNQIPIGDPYRYYFQDTGHVVAFAFLVFYNENGGLDIFGYPISEPMIENGLLVQYFQRARMEWHPERSQDDRIVLGALGTLYMPEANIPPEALVREPAPPNPDNQEIDRVQTFVRRYIIGRDGTQTIFVYATDANSLPLGGVTATAIVHFPSGPIRYTIGPTDVRGIASVMVPIPPLPPGFKVVVDVQYWSRGQTRTTQTFFVPWY